MVDFKNLKKGSVSNPEWQADLLAVERDLEKQNSLMADAKARGGLVKPVDVNAKTSSTIIVPVTIQLKVQVTAETDEEDEEKEVG